MKNEISEKNPYYIPKERYLELKHFCLQYKSWAKQLNEMNVALTGYDYRMPRGSAKTDPVLDLVVRRKVLTELIDMVTSAAKKAGGDYWRYILITVTEGRGYISLTMNDGLQLPRDTYYILIRKFYWLLDKARN